MLPESQEAKIHGQGDSWAVYARQSSGARSVDKEDWLAGLPCSDRLGRALGVSVCQLLPPGWMVQGSF